LTPNGGPAGGAGAGAPVERELAWLGAGGDLRGQLPRVRQQALARRHAVHQAQLQH